MSAAVLESAVTALSLTPALEAITSANNATEMSSSSAANIIGATAVVPSTVATNSAICRYYQRGICRFGSLCRFSHDLSGGDVKNISAASTSITQEQPSTSRRNWINAPVFVPKGHLVHETFEGGEKLEAATAAMPVNRSWAEVVGAGVSEGGAAAVTTRLNVLNMTEPGSLEEMCPYESPCPYGVYCGYALHLELCEMCDQFCLHPKDEAQRKRHKKECLQQHEQAMELSFAIARSKDKTCGICFDTIMEKVGREKRFGILPNCNHIFCLECIRKWRQAKQFEHKITRSCPECRVSSDFVCPSAFWVETKEEKDKLLDDYRKALGITDCKYFKKGDGKCPFGNKCFYKHALPNGELVDVGCPKKGRKMHRSNNEIINLLDIYLYEFLEQRDFSFLDFLATSTSDESDFGDDYDD